MNKIIKILKKEIDKAIKEDEIPVAAIIEKDGKIISKAHNTRQNKYSCINHAEIIAILKAEKKIRDWRLNNYNLYVTLEPCDMCKKVIEESRIKNVYYILPSKYNKKADQTMYQQNILCNDFVDEYNQIIKEYFNNKR